VWVLWITNAFNLIDALDGLAASSALFSTLVICVISILDKNDAIVFLTLALAGVIAGFLRYNFNPASIFLGDCGSLLIGFVLGAIALAGSQKWSTIVAVAIPLVRALLFRVTRACYRYAAKVVTVECISTEYGVLAEIIRPWLSRREFPTKLNYPPKSAFTWLYSGNLGRAHEWKTLVEVQALLEERNLLIRLVFQGDGGS
jgi:hypothetical protein